MPSIVEAYKTAKASINVQFIKFLLVGGLNTLFGFAVFSAFIALKVHYALAALLATLLGILFNFKTYGTLVFRNPDNRLILKFFGVYAITYVLSVVLITVLKAHHLSSYAAGAILVLPMALLSFTLNRKFVFAREAKRKQGNQPGAATRPTAGGIS